MEKMISTSDIQFYLILSWSDARVSEQESFRERSFFDTVSEFSCNFSGTKDPWSSDFGKHYKMSNFVDETSDEITLSSLIQRGEPREWGCIYPINFFKKRIVL